MLTRLIVEIYVWIIEISLWLALLMFGVAGYYLAVPLLKAAGAVLENEEAWKIYGSLLFAVVAFVVLAALVGPFLILVDIRRSVKALERSSGSTSGVLAPERREPSF
jgi:large-conductance mechanosensitive channel